MINTKHILVLAVLSASLVGCDNSGIADLESYANGVRSRPAGAIEPLPKPKPYLPFSYTATFLRDPFQNQDVIIPVVAQVKDKPVTAPDRTRPKQYLEGFDIGSFAMVGTIENDKEHYALLRGAGGIHRVKVGDFIGLNYGQIQSIDDFGIKVQEKLPDGSDGWTERPYNLELKN